MADTAIAGGRGIITALKRWNPASVRVHLADGRTEQVAIPGRKNRRWVQVEKTLSQLRWVRLEALDAKGAIIDVLDNDAPASELEDLDGTGTQNETARMLQLMLRAQEVALARQDKLVNTMLGNNLELSKVLMSRLNALEASHGSMLDLMREKMLELGGDDMKSGDDIMAMLDKLEKAKKLKD
jgi:hypothetical protein